MRMIYLASLLLLIPGTALAEPMTFDGALQRATDNAPSLQASQAGVEARRSASIAARSEEHTSELQSPC